MLEGFYRQHNACLSLKIPASNPLTGSPLVTITAIIDTGFDGFVQIPSEIVFFLGWQRQ